MKAYKSEHAKQLFRDPVRAVQLRQLLVDEFRSHSDAPSLSAASSRGQDSAASRTQIEKLRARLDALRKSEIESGAGSPVAVDRMLERLDEIQEKMKL